MGQITLTEEQAKCFAQAKGRVEIRHPRGMLLGVIENADWTDEQIAEAKRRLASPGPKRTAEQVMERLQGHKRERDAQLHRDVG